MKDYLRAKLILFSKIITKKSHVLTDKSIKEYSILKKISKKRQLSLLNINKNLIKLKKLHIYLGSFQIKNLSMAVLSARLCNLNDTKIHDSLKKIKNVDGRLDLIKKYPNNIRVFIDYAHTPDALQEVTNQ